MSASNNLQLRNLKRVRFWLQSLLIIVTSTFCVSHAAPVESEIDASNHNDRVESQLKKLDASGEPIEMDAQQWSCVKDENTGLSWEKRDPASALHGHDTYIWFQPEQTIPGVSRAHPDLAWADNTCYGFNPDDPASFCNTSAYAQRVNQSNYCGYSDWRLPTAEELLTLVDPQREHDDLSPLLDTRFFPFHDPFLYWTNTVNSDGIVLTIFADNRVFENSERSDNISVRLVRGSSTN